jgi:hypothetical protein
MTRRNSFIGALVLCALSICAFAAASASAEGLTATTCVKNPVGEPRFEDSHCEKEKPVTGEYITEDIKLDETTEAEGDAIGKSELSATLFGVAAIVTCEKAHTTGDVKNITEGTLMRVHGTVEIDYLECHAVRKTNPAQTCTVLDLNSGKTGTILTKPLTFITGPNHDINVTPIAEEMKGPFAEFELKNGSGTCPAALTNVKVTVTGTAVGTANTEKASHGTFKEKVGGGLKANGAEAEYNGTNIGYMKGQPENTIAIETRPLK